MPQITVVESIAVHVATGDTCYPTENGFAALWAEVKTSDPATVAAFEQADWNSQTINVRCAMLDVIGKVTKSERSGDECAFVLSIANLIYRKSGDAANGA